MMKRVIKISLLILFLMPGILCQTTDYKKPQKMITDDDIGPNQYVKFSKDTVYVLEGYVFVEENSVLEIEPGSVIKGKSSGYHSTLVIMQGAKILAVGEKETPIIFTSTNDSLANNYEPGFNEIVDYYWGGIVICGRSTTNFSTDGTGLWNDLKIGEKKAVYGGWNDDDSSGVIKYVSIRYGGISLSGDTFLGGLVLAGCGKKTIVEYVESINSNNESFHFLGGTVECRNLAGIFAGLSGMYIEAYRGKLQNILIIKKESYYYGIMEIFNHYNSWLMESEPKINFSIYNSTIIGNDFISRYDSDIERAISFRHNTRGNIKNSIITQVGIPLIYMDDSSLEKIESGELTITNNLWWLNENYPVFDSMKVQENIIPYLNANNNIITNPLLYGISRTNNGGLDPRPRPESPAWTMELADYPDDDFFEPVNYAGAFGTENWLAGWSWLWQMGYFDTTSTNIEQPDEIFPTEYKLEKTIRIRLIRQQE